MMILLIARTSSKLLGYLIDTGCRKAAHNTNSNGCDVIRGRKIRHTATERQRTQNSARHTGDTGDPLVVKSARLDEQADQVTQHRDGRYTCNPKIHIITSFLLFFPLNNRLFVLAIFDILFSNLTFSSNKNNRDIIALNFHIPPHCHN
jgi:hypothetical protein